MVTHVRPQPGLLERSCSVCFPGSWLPSVPALPPASRLGPHTGCS